jgi:hypothetical protein
LQNDHSENKEENLDARMIYDFLILS